MKHKLIDGFCWLNIKEQKNEEIDDAKWYQELADWAVKALHQNPEAFDAVTEWMLEDAQWCDWKVDDNRRVLMRGIIGKFTEQNARIRKYLSEIAPEAVNQAVFGALDRFDEALTGKVPKPEMQKPVTKMFVDFQSMSKRRIREWIAGNKTGSTGTDSVEIYGYVNYLRDCDAAVYRSLAEI